MKNLLAGLAAIVAAGLGGVAAAQSDLESAINAAVECRSIADNGARLTCLDTAAGALAAARDKLVSAKTEKKHDLLADFGLRGGDDEDKEAEKTGKKSRMKETVEEFGAEGIYEERQARLDDKLKEITATTTKITVSHNEATLYLDNGQVWRQLSADNKVLTYTEKTEAYPVEIKRSAFGAYTATVKGLNRSIKVRRIK